MQQANVLPHLAPGGHVQNLSPADMQASLIVNGQTPQHFAGGSIASLYAQIPAKKAAYQKEQETKAQNVADYYNKPLDPYFQNIIDKAHNVNFDQMLSEANPEPVWQAQPTTATSWTRDQIAKVIGEQPADRLFGTGSEGQKLEYQPLQFVNPIIQATSIADAVPEIGKEIKEGNYLGAGINAGTAGLSVLPFIKPIKKVLGPVLSKFKK
jgi:hypothetical protein